MKTRYNTILNRILFLILLVPWFISMVMTSIMFIILAIMSILCTFVSGSDDFGFPEWYFTMLEKYGKITNWILSLI